MQVYARQGSSNSSERTDRSMSTTVETELSDSYGSGVRRVAYNSLTGKPSAAMCKGVSPLVPLQYGPLYSF